MRTLALASIAFALAWPCAASAAPDAFARSLDRPAATKVVQSKAAGQVTCTYYADLMVRETGTDSPDPDDAMLVPLARGSVRPACAAGALPGGIAVKTEGYGLEGRRGGFLVWDATDPNGAMPFMVMNPGGKVMFQDGLSPTLGLSRAASLQGGSLRLTYTRGFNANCSLAQRAETCWASLVAAGDVPKTMPSLKTTPASCAAAYRKTPKGDPSVVTYKVDVTLTPAGKATVLPIGAVGCQPQP
ncbi:MAG TPA: hypothetical protein VKT30_01945 [Caulobacteraceae bacterium]|nr:hypothetical protein [Caulobacteraceae bacterium]